MRHPLRDVWQDRRECALLEILTYDGLQMRVGKTSGEDLKRYIESGGQQAEIYAKLQHLCEEYAQLIEKGIRHPTPRVGLEFALASRKKWL